jgi:hypothetical protein
MLGMVSSDVTEDRRSDVLDETPAAGMLGIVSSDVISDRRSDSTAARRTGHQGQFAAMKNERSYELHS